MAADMDNMPIARTGVPGLDDVLLGRLTEGNLFLLEGAPGTGKTTIALRFLITGAQAGECDLYLALPLDDFQGVLHGVPSFVGNAGPLLNPALACNGNE